MSTSLDKRLQDCGRSLSIFLVFLVCAGQFLDTFNSSAFFLAIPSLAKDLSLSGNASVWLISSFQITFSSFLLVSGRLTDRYTSKYVFVSGLFSFGALSLASAFVKNKIIFLIFRAFIGIAASLTIPSATHLVVHTSPSAHFRTRALAAFNGSVALGNVIGLVLGAVFVQRASWKWIFYFEAMVSLPIALLCLVVIPNNIQQRDNTHNGSSEKEGIKIDWIASVLLFVLGVTSGASSGWGSALVIVPLVLSACIAAAFFVWEIRYSSAASALPSELWNIPGIRPLCIVSLLPMLWWTQVFFTFSELWQTRYYSSILTAAHLLPVGVLAIVVIACAPILKSFIGSKAIILVGLTFIVAATSLLPFADRKSRYWTFAFPAFTIGTTGVAMIFVHANIAMLEATPKRLTGTVGAMFSTSLQLGAAVGVAAITALQSNIANKRAENSSGFSGIAAGFWLLLGIVTASAVIFSLTFERSAGRRTQTEPDINQNASEGRDVSLFLSSTGEGKEEAPRSENSQFQ
ncbi:MFS general substrate transporter [Punctularia strigosozonata HHB-11173 SS5]|uniref:MFS general substrate transporter n=1 Tax=Punctularia strigosozonata (strain HHB-11173) TaxID=741275 RepID=UPI00044185BA|nr:MFS general substrate transporter [Punctularia strigosozonata HHB-11173 SS5]EIN11084.1 MFS general substrate transporter [Punctularia strigosozonata HHB-11173 SS5]